MTNYLYFYEKKKLKYKAEYAIEQKLKTYKANSDEKVLIELSKKSKDP